MSASFVKIDWQGRPVRIEHQWLKSHLRDTPLMVFLHEGSLSKLGVHHAQNYLLSKSDF